MNAITRKPATKGQIRQIETVGKDALASALELLNPTKVGAQRVLESDEFAEEMKNAAHTALSSLFVTNKYADEEVESKYGYLSGYEKPSSEEAQVVRLKELCPQLGDSPTVGQWKGKIPKGAEGLFYVINIWKPKSVLPGTYKDQTQWMLDMVKEDRNGNYHNYREGQIGPKRFRQIARSKAVFEKLSEEQGHPDILIISAQFGITHRGRSVRRAREVMLDQSQFGLGSFVTGIMLLTHPERLQHYDDFWIDCAGDEYDDPAADARFDHAPCFEFGGGRVKFGARYVGDAHDYYGSASGFLSQ